MKALRSFSRGSQLPLEFRERGEYPEHQPAAVDVGSLAGEHAKADFAFHQLMDRLTVQDHRNPQAPNMPPKISRETAISLAQYPLTFGSESVASATRR